MNYICIAESLHNCLAESASHKPPGWQQAVSRSWTHQNHQRTTSNFEVFFVVHPYSSTKTRDVTWYNLLRTPGMNHHLQAPTIPHLQCHHHRTATRNHDATLETNRPKSDVQNGCGVHGNPQVASYNKTNHCKPSNLEVHIFRHTLFFTTLVSWKEQNLRMFVRNIL